METTAPTKTAQTAVALHPLIAERWSPRRFDSSHTLDDATVLALVEAARWSPSCNNSQPWRLLVTHRGQEPFDRLYATLAPGNQLWAGNASALILIAAKTVDDAGNPMRWAWYDTGQAAAAMVVQAQSLGLSVHQMAGYDSDAVRQAFALPDGVDPVAVAAVGRIDPAAELPPALAEREVAPRGRNPLEAMLLPTVRTPFRS